MAIMIPKDGGYFDPASDEERMFHALEKLPNEYYVFHSYRLVSLIPDKGLNENEIDFLVFNPNYGCLFIECKNRTLMKEDGQWKYLKNVNGEKVWANMPDPFDQAFSGQHNLFNKLKEIFPKYTSLINDLKFMVAIWLPKYRKDEINEENFGQNVIKDIIMTKEALINKNETIRQIEKLMQRMNKVHLVCKYEEVNVIEDGPGYKNKLSHENAMLLFNKVLCPTFRTIVNVNQEYEKTYIQLLEEQYVVLDYLSHQRTAAISGASGTGKTLVAVERARRLSNEGKRVLFLCVNNNLKEDLEKKNKKDMPNVDFYTLDGFGCKMCKTDLKSFSYYDLKDVIENQILEGKFEYQHIIVDEGQDFGRRKEEDSDIKSEILELFADYGVGIFDNEDTSFFIFYDKNQLVNNKYPPKYLQNVDSKLTLYKNCRNTKNIANTAYSLVDSKPVLNDRAWKGETPSFVFYSGNDEIHHKIDNIIAKLSEEGNSQKVIITCSDDKKYSSLWNYLSLEADGKTYVYKSNGKKIPFYTCPTFKGLESDDVIVVDVTNESFKRDNFDYYVSATRAKKRLYTFIDQTKVDFEKVLEERFPDSFNNNDKALQLALAMHGFKK